MAQKYHIDKNGMPAICKATKRPCPLGGDEAHFDTYEEAYEASQAHLENEFDLLASNGTLDNAEGYLRKYYKENGQEAPMEYIRNNPDKFNISEEEKVALAKEVAQIRWNDDNIGERIEDSTRPFVFIDKRHGITKQDLIDFSEVGTAPESRRDSIKRFDPEAYENYLKVKKKYPDLKPRPYNSLFGDKDLPYNTNLNERISTHSSRAYPEDYEQEMGMTLEEIESKYGYFPSMSELNHLKEISSKAREGKEIIQRNAHLPFSEWDEKPEVIAVGRKDGTVSFYSIDCYGEGEDPESTETTSLYGSKQSVRFRGTSEEIPVKNIWHLGDAHKKIAEKYKDEDLMSADFGDR